MERSIGWFKREGMSDDEQRHATAHSLGVPFVTLSQNDIALAAMLLIPEPLSREHNAVAYQLRGHTLEVVVLDLDELQHLDFLSTRYRLVPRLTTRAAMVDALRYYQKHLRDEYGAALEQSESPNLLDTLLRHALMSGASDVHLDQSEKGLLVRYRIHGSLKQAFALPPAAAKNIFAKLRVLANLPRLPAQAGENRLRVDLGSGEDVAVRVASVPTVSGEKLVLHLVRESARRGWTLSGLGFHGEAQERLHHFLNHRKGLLAVEGRGKTTLLYTLLDLLNTPELSLATVEAAVSHVLPRAAQVETGALLSPAAALRGVLKTDPDVVLLDPVESREVATLASAAAGRGMLVLAGVAEAGDLESADIRIRTTTLGKLCDKKFLSKAKLTRAESDALESAGANFAKVLAVLKEEEKVDKDMAWKDIQFARAAGCSECERGYKGLIGVQEVAEKGETVGLNLIEDGLFKAAQGLTTVEEVLKLAQ